MARSRRKTPITPTGGGKSHQSEKWDKQKANRKLRHRVKQTLIEDTDNILPIIRELSDAWSFYKDGKTYWSPKKWGKDKDIVKLMRK